MHCCEVEDQHGVVISVIKEVLHDSKDYVFIAEILNFVYLLQMRVITWGEKMQKEKVENRKEKAEKRDGKVVENLAEANLLLMH